MIRTTNTSSVLTEQRNNIIPQGSGETTNLVLTSNNNYRFEHSYQLNEAITDSYNFLERHPNFLNSNSTNILRPILANSPINSLEDSRVFVESINANVNLLIQNHNASLNLDSHEILEMIQNASQQGIRHMHQYNNFIDIEAFRQRLASGQTISLPVEFNRSGNGSISVASGFDDIIEHFFSFFGPDSLHVLAQIAVQHPSILAPALIFMFGKIIVLFRSSVFWSSRTVRDVFRLIILNIRTAAQRIRSNIRMRNLRSVSSEVVNRTIVNLEQDLNRLRPTSIFSGFARFLSTLHPLLRYGLLTSLTAVTTLGPLCFFKPRWVSFFMRRIAEMYNKPGAANNGSSVNFEAVSETSKRTFASILRIIRDYFKDQFS